MNARQTKKRLKKQISKLQADNDLMRRIIADSPKMQELYDAYNKPLKNVTRTTMMFQEYRSKRTILLYMTDNDRYIKDVKMALADELFDGIKDHITYEVDTGCRMPTITASIFIGVKQ